MKSKAAIQIEFHVVAQQAGELASCADEMQAIRRKLNAVADSLRAGWAGESAELYLQKCAQLAEKLKASEKNLDQAAGVIEKSARAYRDAELAAIQLAQENA